MGGIQFCPDKMDQDKHGLNNRLCVFGKILTGKKLHNLQICQVPSVEQNGK